MVEDVWDCYGIWSEPLPSLEWWKKSKTVTALGRNYYQVWKTSGIAMTIGRNYYPVWNGGRRLRLLRHSIGTTTKYGLVEDIRDYYSTWSEPLSNAVTEGRNCYGTQPRSSVELRWLKMKQDDIWSPYIERRLDGFKEDVYVLQLLQVRQKRTGWQLRQNNEKTRW